MATPLVVGEKIFVAGLKCIHTISGIFTSTPSLLSSSPLLVDDDYFETPIVPGTSPDNTMYVVSRKGKAFRFINGTPNNLNLGASYCGTPPLVDSDGLYISYNKGNESQELDRSKNRCLVYGISTLKAGSSLIRL